MKRRITADTQPATGHTCRDSWGRDGLERRWLLPVADIRRNYIPTDAGVRLVERPDGTITAALVFGGRDA